MFETRLLKWIEENLKTIAGKTESSLVKKILFLSIHSESPLSLANALYKYGMPVNDLTRRFAEELFVNQGCKQETTIRQDNNKNLTSFQSHINNFNDTCMIKEEDLKGCFPVYEQQNKDSLNRNTNYVEDFKNNNRLKEKIINKNDTPGSTVKNKKTYTEFENHHTRSSDNEETCRDFESRVKIKHHNKEINDVKSIVDLRKLSRQTYLGKRERQKLDALQYEIEDEEKMFLDSGVKLSEEELKTYNYNREVFALATERKQQQEAIENIELYHIPDVTNKQCSNLNDMQALGTIERYKDEEKASQDFFFAEQEMWEVEQFRKTNVTIGSNNSHLVLSYSILFEDQVDFIKDEMIVANTTSLVVDSIIGDDIRKQRESLPMFSHKNGILQSLEKYQVLIVEAETGSGKTTQIAQYLNEAGYTQLGKIGCTQPRRVAAMSVAARVAKEMRVQLGREVGYSIRFEDCTSHKTLIKYMTDGMLLREFLSEPDLASYSVVILDEAHERTLHTDILFGLVKDVAKFRTDLRLIISSATLDARKFSEFFDDAPIYKVPGGMFPVEVFYTKLPENDYLNATVQTTMQIHIMEPPGDILIFLTGQEEIEICEELLKQKIKELGKKIGEININPIYANLPTELQSVIFEPTPNGLRKVVIATNIAETSLTIDGIRYVVDSGFVKQNSFSSRTGIESLVVIPISQASARQRAGRAGRTSSGKCYRLYTKWAFENEMEINTIPEIQRTNLANLLLITKSLGISDVMCFDFMDAPPTETLSLSLEQLYALGALNDRGDLTKIGRRMAEIPVDPQIAKMLLDSEKYNVSEEIVTIAAMVSCGASVFYRPKDKQFQADSAHKIFQRNCAGDHITLLTVYNDWKENNFAKHFCYENYIQFRTMKRARDMRDQLIDLMGRIDCVINSRASDHDSIRKCIIAGFFYNVARLSKDGSYQTIINPNSIYIHPSSSLFELSPKYVVYNELILTTKEYMRIVSEITPLWLYEVAPHMYNKKDFEKKTKYKYREDNNGFI